MAARSRSQRADVGIARLARRQHGVVSRRRLLAAGLTRHQISERIRAGRLHRLHGGVYLVGHAVPPRYARETAAVLACPDSIIDRQTSASLWDLLPYPHPGPVRLAIPPGRSAERPGIDARRAVVATGDVRRRHGLP